MTTAWFHCFSGIAGDMALGSLVDAGADLDEVRSMLERLPVSGWSVEAEPVLRGGIAGTKIHVGGADSKVVRTAANIQGLVEQAVLPERVARRAHLVFAALAEAEGRLHRRPPDQVHFHEVGGLDAIVDVVGTCAALEILDVDEIACSPVAVGLGMVRAAHGIIPNPAPAVVALLAGIPTRGVDLSVELTTPTGAAIVAALAGSSGAIPPMTIAATGFGAGSRELDGRPNLTQVVLGEPTVEPAGEGQPVVLLEANVDDVTGEVLAHTVALLVEAGAHDAWVSPVTMKKGRPGFVVSCLADPALADQVAGVLASETGTFGVRGQTMQRWPSERRFETVTVRGNPVRVKVSPGRAKAEFDDAAAAARVSGRPVRSVLAEAEAAWRDRRDAGVGPHLAEVVSDGGGGADDHHHHHEPHDHHHGADGHGHPHEHEHGHPHEHGHGHSGSSTPDSDDDTA